MTALDTVLTILMYIFAGWIALLGVQHLKQWYEHRDRPALWTGAVHALAATVAVAYLVWWPLLLALTWQAAQLYKNRRSRE